MRDADFELPRHAFPLVLPKPDGFEEAVRRGRTRRRHRTAGAGAGVMTLILGVLGVAVLSNGPSASQHIKPTDVSRNPGFNLPYNPGEGTTAPSVAPSTPAGQQPGARPGSRTDDGAGVPGVVHQPDGGTKPGSGYRPPAAPPAVPKPKMNGAHGSQPDPCPPVVNPPQRGWCTDVTVTHDSLAGTSRLTFEMCRDVSEDLPGGLSFRTAQEADFRVVNTGSADVWQWSKGQRFGPHSDSSITVTRGNCYSWWVDWDRTDEQGRNLPSGTYTLQGWSTADGFESREPATWTFSI